MGIPINERVKFFCRDCGKEMWQGVDWSSQSDRVCDLISQVQCSDCVLAIYRKQKKED